MLIAFVDILLGFQYRLMSGFARAESVAKRQEVGLKQWFMRLHERLLQHTICHGRYAENLVLPLLFGMLTPVIGLG